MKNGMNHDQFSIELKKDCVRKPPQNCAAKTITQRLKIFRSSRYCGIRNLKVVQKTKSEARFLIFIPLKGVICFLDCFRLHDDASHDVSI